MSPDLLFEIGHEPANDLDRLETLEPVLAAAALELDIDVLFFGSGVAHLSGDGAERWDQLIDFGLGRLWIEPADSRQARPVVPARGDSVNESPEMETVEQLRRRARKIVGL